MYLRHRRVEEELGWVELGWVGVLARTPCFWPWRHPLLSSLSPAQVLGEHLLQPLHFLLLELEKGNGDGNQSQTRWFAQFSPNPHLLCRVTVRFRLSRVAAAPKGRRGRFSAKNTSRTQLKKQQRGRTGGS